MTNKSEVSLILHMMRRSGFGVSLDEEDERSPDPYPIIRKVLDQGNWVPTGHTKDDYIGPLSDSAKKAILSFLIAVTLRRIRKILGTYLEMLTNYKDTLRNY